MSLGFARDSVANLRALVHEDLDNDTNNISSIGNVDTDMFESIEIDEDSVNSEPLTPSLTFAHTDVSAHPQTSHERSSPAQIRGNNKYESTPSSHSDLESVHEKKPIRSPYSGFVDYADYDIDPYAINYDGIILGETTVNRNLFCCFFPFQNLFDQGKQVENSSNDERTEVKQDLDHIDTVSHPAGHKPNPDQHSKLPAATIQSDSTSLTKSQKEAETSSTQTKPLKGIMRKKFTRAPSSTVADQKTDDSQHRRNLFPTFEPPVRSSTASLDSIHSKHNKKLSFFLMARVITVESRKDLTDMERSMIWWQHTDYDDFKKTARIITQAMIQGGSEIWLQTSNAWGRKQALRSRSGPIVNDDEHQRAIKKYGASDGDVDEEDARASDAFESKWWCRFGHSRRGLEHIVSIEEGKQRQKNVKIAIQAVLDEQERQLHSSHKDSKKLSSISMQYTSWARDLAHAAALADAEAVRSRFDAKAKTRLDYLTKGMNQPLSTGSNVTSASFILSANKIAAASILDANRSMTAYHKKENVSAPPIKEVNVPKRPIHAMSITVGTIPLDPESPDSKPFSQEEIHDPDGSHENIAKLAAGYGHTRKIDIFSGISNLPTANKRIGAF